MKNFYDAFISYGRVDSVAFVKKLYERLTQAGQNIWFDFVDIPHAVDFQTQIDEDMLKAHNFIFVISPQAVNSPYCAKEIQQALKFNKRIIPLVHVEEIDKVTWQKRFSKKTEADWLAYQEQGLHACFPNMPEAIGKINWLWFREDIDDFEESVQNLLEVLDTHGSYVQQHTLYLNQAIRWERQHKQTRYLLTAKARQEAEAWLQIRFEQEQAPCEPTDLHCAFITESIKNAHNLMTQAFLAYADADVEAMRQVRGTLQREGITVWSNETDIRTGDKFYTAIERGIEGADNIIYMLSTAALQSEFCHHELDYALALNKRIIPILVGLTQVSEIPLALRDLQYVDLTDNVNEDDYVLDASQLLNILRQGAAYHETHKILLVQALKWERQNNNPSILLRGYNLRHAHSWLETSQSRTVQPPTELHQRLIAESLRQPPVEALDVFISYSRADSDLARNINDRLQSQGYRTWFDQESIAVGSADFEQEILSGIQSSDNFLFILSPQSIGSKYCKAEVEYAAQLNKRVLTLLYRDIDHEKMHPVLAKVQYLDFREEGGSFNTRFGELIRALATDRDYLRSHTKWSHQAIEWESHDKSTDLLLRGTTYALAENWLEQALKNNKQPPPTPLQQTFIQKSKAAIAAQTRQAKRQVYILRTSLGVVTIALILAFVQWRYAIQLAEQQIISLAKSSIVLSESDQTFDGLLTALRIGREQFRHRFGIKRLNSEAEPYAARAIGSALSKPMETTRIEGHTDKIRDLVFSPDSDLFVTASNDKSAKVWSPTGEFLFSLEHEDSVYGVHFSPDGERLITRGEDQVTAIWDKNGKRVKSLSNQTTNLEISFSSDSQFFLARSETNVMGLWTMDGERVTSFTHPGLSAAKITQRNSVVTQGLDGTVNRWKLDGTPIDTFKQPGLADVYVRQDGRWMVFLGPGSPGSTQFALVSPDSDQVIKWANDSPDNKVVFSQDNQFFVTHESRGNAPISVWNYQGERLYQLDYGDKVNYIDISQDGEMIAVVGESGLVKLWNRHGEQLQSLINKDPLIRVKFSPDGQSLAIVNASHKIKLWSVMDPFVITLGTHQDDVSRVRFSPDGNTVVVASYDGTARLWNNGGRLIKVLEESHKGLIRALEYGPQGNIIATGGSDRTIHLWNSDGSFMGKLAPHDNTVREIAIDPDGQIILSASKSPTLYGWDVSGNLLFQKKGEYRPVFSPQGDVFLSAQDTHINLWRKDPKDPKDPILVHTFSGHGARIEALAMSPDGKTIASAGRDGIANLWSVDGQRLATLPHDDQVRDVIFSPNGDYVATASEDFTVKLWSLSGERLYTFDDHEGIVFQVLFSPDGKILASVSNDQRIRLYHTQDRHLLQELTYPDEIYRVAFSPKGEQIAAAGRHTSAIVWNVPLNEIKESVEFKDHFRWIVGQGCDRIRGYLETKPENDPDRLLCKGIE